MALTCIFAPRPSAIDRTYVRFSAPEKREVNGSTPFPAEPPAPAREKSPPSSTKWRPVRSPLPALATDRPQAYAVVPGPGLLNSGAALITAYGMNAPVLALIGQIPEADIGRGFGWLHEIRDQAGILERLVDWSARIRAAAAN